MEKIQKICVAGFVYHEGRALILKRSMEETFLPGHWDIPGGKLNFGEMPEDALKREAKEEINLNIEPIKPYSLFSYVSKNGQWHCVDIQYIAKIKDSIDNLKLSKDHDEFRWIAKSELGSLFNITSEMKNALKKGFEEIKKK
jgi:8-oxo-dGTP diphosphatase